MLGVITISFKLVFIAGEICYFIRRDSQSALQKCWLIILNSNLNWNFNYELLYVVIIFSIILLNKFTKKVVNKTWKIEREMELNK